MAADGGTLVGLILSTAAVLISSAATGDQFLVWGWRIPFLFAGVLVVVGLIVRLSLEEPPSFAEKKAKGELEKAPVTVVLKNFPGPIILSAFIRLSEQMPFYIFTAFILDYATQHAGIDRTFLLIATLAAAVIDLALLPYLRPPR